MIVAISFTHLPATQSPNLRSLGDGEALNSYFRAMVVTFASVLRQGSNSLVLVTDSSVPEPHGNQLRQLGVDELVVPFAHRPPPGFWPSFNGSLYTLDALQALCGKFPNELVALIDPDCLAVRQLDGLAGRAEATGIAAFPTGFPADEVSNGLSAYQAARIHQSLDPNLRGIPVHYGGECYIFRPEVMNEVLSHAEVAWQNALAEAKLRPEVPRFVTEEHILNYALRYAVVTPLSGEVRRIWTAPTFRNVCGDESRLALWHLPAEKRRGFWDVYPAVVDHRRSWFWELQGDDLQNALALRFGVSRYRRPSRLLYDLSATGARRAQAVFRA